MYSTLLTAALFIAPAIQGALADFAISSPDLVQCQKANISWEPTKGPYNLIVVPAAEPCGDALVEVGDFTKTSISWVASLKAGTQVQLSLVDADDNEAWSKTITVGASNDVSCLSAAASSSAAAIIASASSSVAAATGTGAAAPVGATGAASSTSAAAATETTASASYGPGDSDSGVVPIGAANAGTLGSAGFTVRQISTPLMVLSGLVAAFALSL